MLRLLTILLVVSAGPTVVAENCSKNPLYCKIVTLNPKVDKVFAKQLSDYIHKYSKKFGTDPNISIAIAMQESGFRNINRMGLVADQKGCLVSGATDIGVFQIHVDTISYLKSKGNEISVERLQKDVEYQTYWHTKILKDKVAICTKKRQKLSVIEGNEWSCYHSFTFDKRKIYLNKVNNHLAKLDGE